MKKVIIASAILATVGAITVIVFFIISGLQYRAQEDQGLEPGYTPAPIVLGIDIGLWALGIGLTVFVVAGTLTLARRRTRPSITPSPSED
ncbi:hypothetical protein [Plantibacter flavus]|uniref:hypothetical protein n=1 Tax=Plantibacter flavus TaxID=150123 RepID=UPI001294781A|nr:hypothetical protein [Plantibacter flavus]